MKTLSLDIVQDISAEAFKKFYLKPQRPLIIKDLAKNTPAGKKWSIEYISKVCGDVEVDVFDNAIGNQATAITTPDLRMRFSDYVKTLTSPIPSSLRMFLFNMFKVKPELRKDFKCPEIMRGILGRVGFMFFGAKNIKVRIHQDIDYSNVLLTQFHGRKRVVLVAPRFSKLLYKLPFNTYSLVDLDKPDFERYPGLRHIELYDCVLEPGDSLFMPSGYWHYITYLEGGFAVSYRKMATNFRSFSKGILSLFLFMPFDKFMHFVFGKKWLQKKEAIADRRAEKVLRRIRDDEQIFTGLQTR